MALPSFVPPSRPVHGAIGPAELRRLGLPASELLDFSASISPLGPPPGVGAALRAVNLAAYPDPECLELREAIAAHLRGGGGLFGGGPAAPPERILAGNGSTEIFHLLARAWLSGAPDASALLLTPTYGEYRGACALAGAPIHQLEATAAAGFRWDLAEAAAAILRQRPRLVFLCNPNNPTGVYLRPDEVSVIADAAAQTGSLLALDEAYLGFVAQPWDSLPLLERDNVLLVRSMTKDYALTGLRLGYALAPAAVAARLRAFQPDWSVNSLAQAAGVAALADGAYLPRARAAMFEAKAWLTAELTRLGWPPEPTEANFLLLRVGDAARWRAALLPYGVVVRDCASFGLPEYLRIGIRPLPDCRRLAEAVAAVGAASG